MKKALLLSLAAFCLALLLPNLLRRTAVRPVVAAPALRPESETASPAGPDGSVTVTLLHDGEVLTLTMAEYLPGAVAGEMPASFAAEALRAQAVASRTYALRRAGQACSRHPQAALCDDPGCCQRWLDEEQRRTLWGAEYDRWAAAVEAAEQDTDGAILVSGGEPILACFHASSPGRTESSAAVWGAALPYLVSVDSPESAETVPGFVTEAVFSPEEFRAAVLDAHPAAGLTGKPETWLGQRVTDAAGRTALLQVGDAALTGTELRQLFSLRSAAFTLEWTGESFLFTVTGSGHGAGMSQYGANVMAAEGASWREILAHYYPGTELGLMA